MKKAILILAVMGLCGCAHYKASNQTVCGISTCEAWGLWSASCVPVACDETRKMQP